MHLKSVAAAVTVGAAVLVGCESPVPNKFLDLSCAASAEGKAAELVTLQGVAQLP